jgi:hypothetical protein
LIPLLVAATETIWMVALPRFPYTEILKAGCFPMIHLLQYQLFFLYFEMILSQKTTPYIFFLEASQQAPPPLLQRSKVERSTNKLPISAMLKVSRVGFTEGFRAGVGKKG